MNSDSVLSFLSHSNWVFLGGLVLLLAAACVLGILERPRTKRTSDTDRTSPR